LCTRRRRCCKRGVRTFTPPRRGDAVDVALPAALVRGGEPHGLRRHAAGRRERAGVHRGQRPGAARDRGRARAGSLRRALAERRRRDDLAAAARHVHDADARAARRRRRAVGATGARRPTVSSVCQTEARRGGRLLTVRSNVVFANSTEYELAVRAVDARGRTLATLGVLAPGARFALPVGLAHRCRVQVRPVLGSLGARLEHDGDRLRATRRSESAAPGALAHRRGDAAVFTLRYSVEHNKSVSMETGARLLRSTQPQPLGGAAAQARAAPIAPGDAPPAPFVDYCVVFRFPLHITNALPLPLTYRIGRGRRQRRAGERRGGSRAPTSALRWRPSRRRAARRSRCRF
jgi:hypothetical protein